MTGSGRRDDEPDATTREAGRKAAAELFAGPGEVRTFARTLDWGATPVGWPQHWSPALRIATRAMLEAPFPICLWAGPEYALVYNDAYRRVLGAKHPAALGQPGAAVWAEIWAGVAWEFEQARAGGPAVFYEQARFEMARRPGGGVEEAWFSYSLSPLRDEDGSVAAVLNICPETTARVLAEQALVVERARLQDVFRRAPSFIVAYRGPDLVYEFVNEAYNQIIGFRDVLGRKLLDAIPEIRGQGFDTLLQGVRESGEPWVGREVPVQLQRTPNAPLETRYLDMVFQPLTDADGTRSGVVVHGSDITEQVLARREAERARDRTDRLQQLTAALAAATSIDEVADVVVAQGVAVSGARTGMLALRASRRSLSAAGHDASNLVVLRQTGLPADIAAAYASLPVASPGPTATSVRQSTPCFLENRAAVAEQFPESIEAWDRLGSAALAAVPLAVGGHVIGAVTFTFGEPRTFPTEEREFFLALGRQAAQALERARLLAAERDARAEAEAARVAAEAGGRAKADFLATMSHEIRTPINAIVGYTQLLELGVPDAASPAQRQQLGRISGSAQHLLGLVNDILDVAKIDAGEMRVARDQVRAGPPISEALALVGPQADERGIRVVLDPPTEPGFTAFVGDAARLRQILVNLLSNAVKFTAPGGRVTVTAGTMSQAPPSARVTGHGPWTFVSVADTGIGIPPEQQGSIFEPFVQAERGHTRTKGGTGLGLTISRRLARLMGGDLTLESTPGAGSTFAVWLPAVGVKADGEPESPADRGGRAGRADGGWRVHGLAEIGRALREDMESVIEAYVATLRSDPLTALAREAPSASLEDHALALLASLSQTLVTADGAGDAGQGLMADGVAILRSVAERHGLRRLAQGWSEEAVGRDHDVMREVIARSVLARVSGRVGDAGDGLRVLEELQAQTRYVSLAAYRRAVTAP